MHLKFRIQLTKKCPFGVMKKKKEKKLTKTQKLNLKRKPFLKER